MPKNSAANESIKATLRRWRVMEIESHNGDRTRHVLGHDDVNSMGRTTSAIKEFNKESMIVTTKSGSCYKLVGLPGNSRLGDKAWKKWCAEYGVVSKQDVTAEYFSIDHASTLDIARIQNSLLPQDNL